MKTLTELPLYMKIADDLRARLLMLPVGAPFETEQALTAEFNVARGTIRQALNVLVQEGLLHRTQGSGSFRSQPSVSAHRFTLTQDLTDSILEIGSNSDVRNLSVTLVPASPAVADVLHIPRSTKVRKVTRRRIVDGKPFAYCEGYLRTDSVPQFFKRDYDTSLGNLVRNKLQVHIGSRSCTIRALEADTLVSEMLSIPVGSPVLRVGIICFGFDKEPLLFDMFYLTPSQTLHFNL